MKRSPRVLSGSLVLVLLVLILALLGGGVWLVLRLRQSSMAPSGLAPAVQSSASSSTTSLGVAESRSPIPSIFVADLPATCRQVLLVMSPKPTSIPAELTLLERTDANADWTCAMDPLPVTLGRNGLAWGVGEHRARKPEGFREKREGDGCSPAGVFRVPFAFGMGSEEAARKESPGLKLPYTHLGDSVIGVDDPESQYYNQVVDSNLIPRDWNSHEPMNRFKVLYRWGAFIAHNPEGVPNLGSCIFIHIWPGPGESTAGCTGMSDPDVVKVLTWLDPLKEPRLVQGIAAWAPAPNMEPPQTESGD